MYYQQGDVLIESCESVPEGAKEALDKGGIYILAEGEVTGHKHAIEKVGGMEFLEKDGMFYIVNKNPVVVKHEEHRPITIPSGIWKVGGVREYDHFAEEARRVID